MLVMLLKGMNLMARPALIMQGLQMAEGPTVKLPAERVLKTGSCRGPNKHEHAMSLRKYI